MQFNENVTNFYYVFDDKITNTKYHFQSVTHLLSTYVLKMIMYKHIKILLIINEPIVITQGCIVMQSVKTTV